MKIALHNMIIAINLRHDQAQEAMKKLQSHKLFGPVFQFFITSDFSEDGKYSIACFHKDIRKRALFEPDSFILSIND